MRFARTCLSIVIALGALPLVDAASAAPDDQTAGDSGAQPPSNAAFTAAETTASPAKDRRHTREQRRQQEEAATAAATAASAQPAQPQVAAAVTASDAAQAPAAPKKICKNMDVVGSKIPRRVCATQDEWAGFENRAREDAQDGLRHLKDQGAVAPPSPTVNTSSSIYSPPTR